jgi:8-oxo-dGTP pyrophosphatase MutT (NUDIX family)
MNMAKLLRQYAALPVMDSGGTLQVLLVTSRGTGRWIIPKGQPEKGMKPRDVAKLEAFEEAGVTLGAYRSTKRLGSGKLVPCEVVVFRLQVSEHLADWKEDQQRRRLWVPLAQASRIIDDAGLAAFIERLSNDKTLSNEKTLSGS